MFGAPGAGSMPAPAAPDLSWINPFGRDDAAALAGRLRRNSGRDEGRKLIEGMAERQEVAKCRICGKVYPHKQHEDGWACIDCARKEAREAHPVNAALAAESSPAASAKTTTGGKAIRKPTLNL